MNLFLLGGFMGLALVVLGEVLLSMAGIRGLLTESPLAKIMVVAARDGLTLIMHTAAGKAEK
jgi:hypothetical protein